MPYLVFDTETTGLYNFKIPSHAPSQPWVIQLAARVYSDKDEVLDELLLYVFPPEGVKIGEEAINVHGITEDVIRENDGVSQEDMLDRFKALVDQTDYIVGYNTPFDMGLIEAAAKRTDFEKYGNIFGDRETYCVMRALTGVLQIPPFRYGTWKWPRLEEAVPRCLGREHEGAHDAMVDVQGTAELFRYCMMLEQLNKREPDVKKHFQLR